MASESPPAKSGRSSHSSGHPACSLLARRVSLWWKWRRVTLGTSAGEMVNHLQTIKRSTHCGPRSLGAIGSCIPRCPRVHPHWDPSGPCEHDGLALQDTDLPPQQLWCLQHLPLVSLGACWEFSPGLVSLHPHFLSKSHSVLLVLKVWSAES